MKNYIVTVTYIRNGAQLSLTSRVRHSSPLNARSAAIYDFNSSCKSGDIVLGAAIQR